MPDLTETTKQAAKPSPQRPIRPIPLPEPITVGIPAVRAMTGLGLTVVRELIMAGTLRSIRIGGRRLVFVDSVRELLKQD